MKPITPVVVAVCAFLASSCASKAPYQDSSGRRSDSVPTYSYGATTAPVANARISANPTPQMTQGRTAAPWPRVFVSGGTSNTVYQPQVDSWDGTTLVARSAVAIQTSGQTQPLYGVVNLKATTLVDKTERTVTLDNIQLVSADFPSAPDKAQDMLQRLREQFPKQIPDTSLDSLESSLAANDQQLKGSAQPLNNTPPKIIFSTAPAVLISIDGPPVYHAVTGTDLERVLNTSVLLLKDKQPRPVFYLRAPDGYLQAPTLDGPWKPGMAPPGAELAEKEANQAGQTDFAQGDLGGQKQSQPAEARTAPEVYVSTTPTELISFNGQPDFVLIPGTKLLYASNTTGNVFKLMSDQQTYVLISGRWYRAPGLGGPWEYVPGAQLPRDFAQIPDSSPKENVKASVPGTPQAREALIANSIPQTSGMVRTNQMQDPGIDGPPQLSPIQGTPLQYVVNSGTPIIRVDENSWYACQNGVWYAATAVNGPWTVAASVPAVIYSIPPSSPMHYVTYVRVYDSTPDTVYVGYTPGYLGTVVSSDYVVVYGTGYYYQPWIGSVWYAPPVTWGWGCGPFWAPWTGWSFGFGFGWYAGYYPYYWYPYPCWGPYGYWHHHHYDPYYGPGGYAHTAVNVYHRPAARAPVFARDGSTTTTQRPVYGQAYNSRTGSLAAGQRAQVNNVFQTSSRSPGRYTVGPNNAYATRDGRVFVREGGGRSTTWRSPTAASSQRVRQAPTPDLDREAVARSSSERHDSAGRSTGFAPPEPSRPASPPPSMRGGDSGGRGFGGRGGRER